ncbi:MAG: phosphoribosylaminoimidazolesuccinocarboxamide synthase [Planctomycetota bacterium]
MRAVVESRLRAPCVRGKVRDVYTISETELALIATDRVSAFDVVLPTPLPGKGVLLTSIAEFWLGWIESRGLARTHLISTDADRLPDRLFEPGGTARGDLVGRTTIARRAEVLPIEFVVRGYLEGSGWREYSSSGRVCGHRLPPGLARCGRLPEPILTPATKAAAGAHDENITESDAASSIGAARYEQARAIALRIFREASAYAEARGLILADTKFEFGIDPEEPDSGPIVVDEALTPDSSRFWPADGYAPGKPQPSFDKQYVRAYLEQLVAQGRWNRSPPGPELPGDIVSGTLERYREAVERLTVGA